MLKTVSKGQSIHQYIPPYLKRIFYNNPSAIHASQNGKDPYGISPDGLVLHLPLWALNNGGTNSIQSVDAYRRTGTITGASWTPQGRSFDGSDDNIDCGTSAALNPLTAITIRAWFKATEVTIPHCIAGRNNNSGGHYSYALSHSNNAAGDLYFLMGNALGGAVALAAAEQVAINPRYLAHAICHGSNMYLYKNGLPVGGPQATVGMHNDGAVFHTYIGKFRTGPDGIFDFAGLEAEVSIFSVAWSSTMPMQDFLATRWRYH